MKITIDGERCTGHGVCEGYAEDIFEVGDDGLAHVLTEPGDDRLGDVREAAANCPTDAISVQE